MDTRYNRIEMVRSRDAPTYIEAGIVDIFRKVERVIDWYHDEAPLEGPPRIASEVAMVERENEVPSSTPDLLASCMHRDVETMESDPGWMGECLHSTIRWPRRHVRGTGRFAIPNVEEVVRVFDYSKDPHEPQHQTSGSIGEGRSEMERTKSSISGFECPTMDGLLVSRPSHNLSGYGRAATSRDTSVTNRSDESLRAGRTRQS